MKHKRADIEYAREDVNWRQFVSIDRSLLGIKPTSSPKGQDEGLNEQYVSDYPTLWLYSEIKELNEVL